MLTQKQINNLITGRAMAAELTPSKEGLRRFLQIQPLELGQYGRYVAAGKSLSKSKLETVFFWTRIYELPAEYIEKRWDVTEEDMSFYLDLGKIQGISALETALGEYLQDFDLLVTWDKTEAPL